MADMRQLLLKLGENLVHEHEFKPYNAESKTTDPLLRFVLWLDQTPEARQELEKLGYSFQRTAPLIF
jgi:hypothetical protein